MFNSFRFINKTGVVVKFGLLVALFFTSILSSAEQVDPLALQAREEWHAYIKPLLPAGEDLVALMDEPNDELLRRELYQFIFAQLSAYYVALLHSSPEYPEFRPSNNEVYNFAYPNPDDVYQGAHVDGKGVYRISGYRGTVRVLDLSVAGGPLHPTGQGALGQTFANYNFDDLHIGKNGYFEVVVSAERPSDHQGDWWPLDLDATYFVVRQRMYDVNAEVDARLAIERLDVPAIRPRATAKNVDKLLKDLSKVAYGWFPYAVERINDLRKAGLYDKFRVRTLNQYGGVSYQYYIEGLYDLAEDEALIVETEVPDECRYWNFQLSDFLWRSIGWMNSQSSVNGHTARLDTDGKFRAVVSSRDPGVPNWLDTTGIKKGIIYGRWTGCSSQPVPTMQKVKLAEVRKVLPADTPVVTPEERDAAIRKHREGVQLRHKW